MVERKTVFYIRRAIFLLMAAAVAVPLLVRVELPVIVGWPARNLYEAVERVPPDKIIVISANWAAGTKGETWPQTEALIHHLTKRGKRFAIWSWGAVQGPELAQTIAEPLARKYGHEYGVDWVNWGFKTGGDQMVRGWAKDIPGTVKEDFFHTPVEKLPIMQHARAHDDIGLIVEITGAATVGTYVRFLYGVYGTPVGYACTGVLVPEAFPYLDAKQIVGMMRGLAGAAEYEKLVGFRGQATKRMAAQSFTHLLIIALIVAGNAGYFWRRRQRGRMKAEG